MLSVRSLPLLSFTLGCLLSINSPATGQTKTWDGRYSTEEIVVQVVYFVPSDRQPLTDWKERASYFCKRIEQFHEREFQGQSRLNVELRNEPFVSKMDTDELREGDANAIYYRTLREVDEAIEFGRADDDRFPILLVLSEINWRPLDDFYRLKTNEDGSLSFEGNYNGTEHFPGATSGGARALYNPRGGFGWGLVSADGWRVPYRGSDCVVYHEGCGHTVGLPHPEPGNRSVMSLGQYYGWISESYLDRDQKERLGWKADESWKPSPQLELFTSFQSIPHPKVPTVDQPVELQLNFPDNSKVKRLSVKYQTSIEGPWIEVPQEWEGDAPKSARLTSFSEPTPVSYRVETELEDGSTAELWGYFQVRITRDQPPMPEKD